MSHATIASKTMSRFTQLSLAFVLSFAIGCTSATTEKTDKAPESTSTNNSTSEGAPDPNKLPTKTTPTPEAEDPNAGVVKGGEGQEYTLRLNLPTGFKQVYTYSVDTFIDPRNLKADDPQRKIAPEYSSLKSTGEMEIKLESASKGTFTLVNTPKVATAVGTGSWKQQADEMLKNPNPPQKYTWDERMRNVNIGKEDFVDPLTNTLNGLLPKGPVKVGSTWTYKPFPKATVMSNVKVEKVDVVSGIETLKLSIDTPSATEGEKMQFLVWINPKDGMYVRTELHIDGTQKGLISRNDFVQTIKQ